MRGSAAVRQSRAVALAVALLAMLVGVGLATAGDASAARRTAGAKPRVERLHACVAARRARWTPTTATRRCPRGQRKVSWAIGEPVAGPRGPQGPAGPAGAVDAATLKAIVDRLDRLEAENAQLKRALGELSDANAQLRATVDQLEGETARLATGVAGLQALLEGVRRIGATLRFEGMNLQLVNGAGTTDSANGLGNLIVGYNESPPQQTGSHVVAIGRGHVFTRAIGLVAGQSNVLAGVAASVLGGIDNVASGPNAVVAGGSSNLASGPAAVVLGGYGNEAGGGGLGDHRRQQ